MPGKKSSEFRAYPWITKKLKLRDWNTANPIKNPKGEVYCQNECHSNAEIAKALGKQKPENVVRIYSDTFWIIEAKEGRTNINKASKEAQEYADAINESSKLIKAPFATGVAGNDEDGYEVRNYYLRDNKWELIRVGKITLPRLLSKKEAVRILEKDSPNLERPELSLTEVVTLSNVINETLHIAKVEKEQRATLVSILLLALHQDPSLRYTGDPRIFISDINARAEKVFVDAGKSFLWEMIKIRPSKETLEAQANALSTILERIKEADILHAAQTSDVLGSFFENFLRYGNTSKELGIVLTPRHICWLAAESLGVSDTDIVYDPAAGTGGFLIASFNRVRSTAPDARVKAFAKNNLYGIEASSKAATLAFINMYFRGDGKHNLLIDSCFEWKLRGGSKAAKKPQFKRKEEKSKRETLLVTKVMMNPPFSLKDDVQKEPDFIDHALNTIVDKGILFSVLPASVMYQFKIWRSLLLENHTLLAVVAFPVDLFYPISTETLGVFIKKGVPHDLKRDVLWARIRDDAFVKRKGFRVERKGLNYQEVLRQLVDCLQGWVTRSVKSPDLPGEYEFSPISSNEYLPQAHLGTPPLNLDVFEREVGVVYKNLATQLWDQQQQYGEDSHND